MSIHLDGSSYLYESPSPILSEPFHGALNVLRRDALNNSQEVGWSLADLGTDVDYAFADFELQQNRHHSFDLRNTTNGSIIHSADNHDAAATNENWMNGNHGWDNTTHLHVHSGLQGQKWAAGGATRNPTLHSVVDWASAGLTIRKAGSASNPANCAVL